MPQLFLCNFYQTHTLEIQQQNSVCLCIIVQSLGHVRLFVTPWTTAHQASLFFIASWSLLKLVSIESVMPSNHLILHYPLLLLPSIFPIIRVFSKESALRIRWPKYWSFSFNISPSNNQSWLFIARTDVETAILWSPDAKSWLIGKDPDAGRDGRQKEKGTAEDEMVR